MRIAHEDQALLTGTGWPQPFRFTGKQTDPTGLQYLRARYYDPSIGRFLTPDPLASVQRYAYPGDNPARSIDPTGLCVPRVPCPGPLDTARDWLSDRGKDTGAVGWYTLTHPWLVLNGGLRNESLGWLIGALSSCDRQQKESGVVLYQNCGGVAGWISRGLTGGRVYTIGSFIFSPGPVNPELLRHELAHVTQYNLLGEGFLPIYWTLLAGAYLSCGFDADCALSRHPLERLADWQAGTNVY